MGEFKIYEMNLEADMCRIDETQRNQLIDWFMAKTWTIVITLQSKAEKFFCPIKVANLKKRTEFIYDLELTGKDEVGTSKITGVLSFQG